MVGIALHGTGIPLLLFAKEIDSNVKVFLINQSSIDISMCILSLAYETLCIKTGGCESTAAKLIYDSLCLIWLNYYLNVAFMTFERFLQIYLNIR